MILIQHLGVLTKDIKLSLKGNKSLQTAVNELE